MSFPNLENSGGNRNKESRLRVVACRARGMNCPGFPRTEAIPGI